MSNDERVQPKRRKDDAGDSTTVTIDVTTLSTTIADALGVALSPLVRSLAAASTDARPARPQRGSDVNGSAPVHASTLQLSTNLQRRVDALVKMLNDQFSSLTRSYHREIESANRLRSTLEIDKVMPKSLLLSHSISLPENTSPELVRQLK